MLIRDVTLADAIGDLIDNSVDGAKVLCSDKIYSGLTINIEVNKERFRIYDNCGGIDAVVAKNYAFRFGRPKEKPINSESIGQFGIGMKRSLFKMGKEFTIKSKSIKSTFSIHVDVNEWQNDTQTWDFEFLSLYQNQENRKEDTFTEIIVTQLNPDIKEQFSDNNFLKKLIKEIELENLYNIANGMKITINSHELKGRDLRLLENKSIKTAMYNEEFLDGSKLTLYAGIGENILEDGGWYIFCNDRLIVGPDQTELSGWTGTSGDGGPNYHGQYQRFRGYAFINANDSSVLPWNTTKNGMDRDSPRFKYIRLKMIEIMKPVITFLNFMKKEREKDSLPTERPLEQIVENSSLKKIEDYSPESLSHNFSFPTFTVVKPIDSGKISYSKPLKKIQAVMRSLEVSSYKEAGMRTFDYYYEMEIEGK